LQLVANNASHAASERIKLACLITVVGAAVLHAAYDGCTYWYRFEGSKEFSDLAWFVFLVALVMWVDEDSRAQPSIYRPFEHGLLALLFWIPYLPYYFWRTRKAGGLLMLAGLLTLFYLGWLIAVATYLLTDEFARR
jgi:hypothetical protein